MKIDVGKWVRFFSLGKYQTTLYTKHGSAFVSSIKGGIFTIFLSILILSYSVNILIDTIMKGNYEMTIKSDKI